MELESRVLADWIVSDSIGRRNAEVIAPFFEASIREDWVEENAAATPIHNNACNRRRIVSLVFEEVVALACGISVWMNRRMIAFHFLVLERDGMSFLWRRSSNTSLNCGVSQRISKIPSPCDSFARVYSSNSI